LAASVHSDRSRDRAALPAVVRDFPPGLHVPEQAVAGPSFDVDRATDAWLDTLSPEQRILSDSYFEGGYWLRLCEVLYSVSVYAALLVSGISLRMRDIAERVSHRPLVSVALYGGLFVVVDYLLSLPLTIYSNFIREHQYGLSNLERCWRGSASK
jgi:STE24 endopeptidase